MAHCWTAATSIPPTPRIVYDANDGTARDLAERFVGLVKASGPCGDDLPRRASSGPSAADIQRATGLTGEALARARGWAPTPATSSPSTAGRSIRAATCRP